MFMELPILAVLQVSQPKDVDLGRDLVVAYKAPARKESLQGIQVRQWIVNKEHTISFDFGWPRFGYTSDSHARNRLRDGSKIHASSALLLQLIHTCAERPVVDPVSPDFQELQRPAQKIEMQKVRLSKCTTSCGGHMCLTFVTCYIVSPWRQSLAGQC